ncbi:MAG: hypothetical protein Q4C70_15370, partial [Planctomycetia bacterium]|nr:hypothetical protein [Planctomycetia bacterium]
IETETGAGMGSGPRTEMRVGMSLETAAETESVSKLTYRQSPEPENVSETTENMGELTLEDYYGTAANGNSAENAESTYYAPGQNTYEGTIYAPGQSSINQIHRPGQSTAENLRRANPQMGMTAAPTMIPAPVSPSALMHGRDSVSHGGGAYHYNPNSRVSGSSGSRGSLQWEQMLELQGGAETLKNTH